jgi:hypothetical protein
MRLPFGNLGKLWQSREHTRGTEPRVDPIVAVIVTTVIIVLSVRIWGGECITIHIE